MVRSSRACALGLCLTLSVSTCALPAVQPPLGTGTALAAGPGVGAAAAGGGVGASTGGGGVSAGVGASAGGIGVGGTTGGSNSVIDSEAAAGSPRTSGLKATVGRMSSIGRAELAKALQSPFSDGRDPSLNEPGTSEYLSFTERAARLAARAAAEAARLAALAAEAAQRI